MFHRFSKVYFVNKVTVTQGTLHETTIHSRKMSQETEMRAAAGIFSTLLWFFVTWDIWDLGSQTERYWWY